MKKSELRTGVKVSWIEEGKTLTGVVKKKPLNDWVSVLVPNERLKIHYSRLMKG